MFYQLPPVGNPVTIDRSKELKDVAVFSSYQTQFYASGTAALAAALVASLVASLAASEAVSKTAADKSKKESVAEVILPAYACPDLISAAVFAGIKPVLVDLEADTPWHDLSLLKAAITENTVAIVAVNLFGMTERWSQLREISDQYNLLLIEDSAQYFPGGNESYDWQGDLVVLSFGRGKPVSLLGGGAVLTKKKLLHQYLPKPQVKPSAFKERLIFSLKVRVYNVMISPLLYWLPETLPFLHLGETRYHPLLGIDAMDQLRLDMLAGNIARYQSDVAALSRCKKISAVLASSCKSDSVNKLINLPVINDMKVKTRLLRYPLLVDESSRDRVFEMLKKAGLGASLMYPESLPKITGLENILEDKEYKNAEMFAARIVTLPTHAYVNDKVIAKMKAVIEQLEIEKSVS